MTTYDSPQSDIHLLARGFLVSKDSVILCRVKDTSWYFLPGGHVENGESSISTLFRELNEEIGDNPYKITSFMGICESIFNLEDDLLQHELTIVYEVEINEDMIATSKEKHLEFVKIKKKELSNYEIRPQQLKEGLLEWTQDRKPFSKIDTSSIKP